jgi:SAM-dependent methyltransferase
MDDIARYNQERWEELARARIVFSRPTLDLDAASARRLVDPHDIIGDVAGRDVLCLAGGGGQQSAAFGVLGARVTVLDISETQLERDREAAAHYGYDVRTVQGDMRDLSPFEDGAFDVVWHAHSINFVPDPRPVFAEVRRVLRAGAVYHFDCLNPFVAGLDERDWTGDAYPLRRPYVDGEQLQFADMRWTIWYEDGSTRLVEGPKEFRHALGTLVNGLVARDLAVVRLDEILEGKADAEPGSWDHFQAVAPPYLSFWTRRA